MQDCGFAHLFEKEGFIDALPGGPQLPQGVTRGITAQIEEQKRPLLEGAASGGDGLFAALGQLEAATVRLLNAA